jgi:hypothetical protein
MTAILGLLTSRLGIIGIGVIVLGLVYGAWSIQVSSLRSKIATLEDQINNPDPEKGLIAKRDQLRGYIAGYVRNERVYKSNEMIFRARIAIQNDAVAMWKARADRLAAQSREAAKEAELERAAAGKLAAEIIATRPTSNAVLDSNLLILRAVQ